MSWVNLYRKLRILPLMMLVIAAALFVRVQSAEVNLQRGLFVTTASVHAEEHGGAETKADEHKHEAKSEDKKDAEPAEGDKKDEHAEGEKKPEEPIDPLDISKQEMRASSELAILQELADRRRQLDDRESAIAQKEALLKAGEARFDEKIQELTKLRNEVKALVDAAKKSEDDETKRLVTVYEKMKAKDAANILNSMDMMVLLPIVSGMKETKLSPILAAMPPEKARQITDALAKGAEVLPQDTPVRKAAEAAAADALSPAAANILPPPPPEPDATE